jgi:hypothetical protein
MRLLVALAVTSFGNVRQLSAECLRLEPTAALKYHADVAFVADLLRVDSGIATLRVTERLKGKVPDEVVLLDGSPGINSRPVFIQPGQYLVFAEHFSSDEPVWQEIKFAIPLTCPQTRLLKDVNARELKSLQAYVKINRKALDPGELK